MTQIWLQVIICLSATQCDMNNTYHNNTEYTSELLCEEAGLKILRSSTGMKGKIVFCLKGIK